MFKNSLVSFATIQLISYKIYCFFQVDTNTFRIFYYKRFPFSQKRKIHQRTRLLPFPPEIIQNLKLKKTKRSPLTPRWFPRLPWESSGPFQLPPPPGIGIFSISKEGKHLAWAFEMTVFSS